MEAIANTLGLNWQGLLWHLINFAVLFFLLQRFLFKPISVIRFGGSTTNSSTLRVEQYLTAAVNPGSGAAFLVLRARVVPAGRQAGEYPDVKFGFGSLLPTGNCGVRRRRLKRTV